jgi:type VI secretion system protein ImpG
MSDDLLPYYERELTFLRQMGAEYRERYPKIASRLRLEPDECADPHVERLIESFALLAARVHHKIDDEFPEITESFLDALYPHYLRPIPSMAIAQFELDPGQSKVTAGVEVPTGTPVESQPEEGIVATFRTCYPATLWPLAIVDAGHTAGGDLPSNAPSGVGSAVRITLRCRDGAHFSSLRVPKLRFCLRGEARHAYSLYELLFSSAAAVSVRVSGAGAKPVSLMLPGECVRAVGFHETEAVLPYTDRSFAGYRLIQEYFHFPEKFLFFELDGLDRMDKETHGDTLELAILLRESNRKQPVGLTQGIGKQTFQLGCTPIVNLFPRIAEPIRLTHAKSEYRIIPDQHRQLSTEVYSVDEVSSISGYQERPRLYAPFYSARYSDEDRASTRFWIARRRESFRENDHGTEVYLSLLDRNFNPALPPDERLNVSVTCTNRDFAGNLRLRGEFGELQAEGMPLVRARALSGTTPAVRMPLGGGLQWRLISHLSLNHLSIVEKGKDALQDILRLYEFTGRPEIRKQIAGITAIASRSAVSRILSPTGVTFCRGIDVDIEFDEEQFVGSGVFLFAAVLERFLGLYAGMNSFSRLTARVARKGELKQWPPRAGEQILL